MVFEHRIRHWSCRRQNLYTHEKGARQVLREIVGAYSSHPSGPLSLLVRVPSLSDRKFFELEEKRLVYCVPAMRLSVYMLPMETAARIFSATIPDASDPVWDKRYAQKGRRIPPENLDRWRYEILASTNSPVLAAVIRETKGIPTDVVK